MREIVLDTETTGFEPKEGHRLVEIGCVEVHNFIPTGRTYHQYINPERDMPAEAFAVHGLSDEFLAKQPVFSQVYAEMMEFIDGAPLVIHNAAFDMKFLNYELTMVGHKGLPTKNVIDTLLIARKKFPGSPANLDALCRRFEIDNSNRELHGALLDAELLAEIYLELMGGRQHALGILQNKKEDTAQTQAPIERPFREPRPFSASDEELAAHKDMLEKLDNALWLKKDAG